MTKVEAYKAVISGEITEDVVSKFEELLATHEAEGEKRRNRAAEKRAEKLEGEKVLEEAILGLLGEDPMTASDICAAVEDIKTPQKATVIAKRLVGAGLVAQTEVKGKNGKTNFRTIFLFFQHKI